MIEKSPLQDEFIEEEEDGIYSSDERENLVDSEEISAEEDAFMQGYLEAG